MKKINIQNLSMIVTNKCNINCAHCMRGEKNDETISNEVIEKTLEQINYIDVISICGGEPTLVISKIEKIISYIIKNHITLKNFAVTINGTIYSQELLKLLDEINNYIGKDTVNALLDISLDKFHLDEIEKLDIKKEYIYNLKRYTESKYFDTFRTIDLKLFDEGNAKKLDKSLTTPLEVLSPIMTYINNLGEFDIVNGRCFIGPLISVNTKGIITEGNASIFNQETLYNYGNVLTDSIENICIKNGTPILKPKKFEKELERKINRYLTY